MRVGLVGPWTVSDDAGDGLDAPRRVLFRLNSNKFTPKILIFLVLILTLKLLDILVLIV